MNQTYREALKKRYKEKEEICKKFRESKYVKEGSVFKMYSNDIKINVYTGPGTPKQFKAYNEIQTFSTNKRFFEACVRKITPVEQLKLSSFINRPPWVDYVHFYMEEEEM